MRAQLSDTLRALLAHAASLYAASAKERARLCKHELRQKAPWSALGEIELFSTEVAGTATTAISQGDPITTPVTGLLDDPVFFGWFCEHHTTYPLLCSYVIVHEHMRLLLA